METKKQLEKITDFIKKTLKQVGYLSDDKNIYEDFMNNVVYEKLLNKENLMKENKCDKLTLTEFAKTFFNRFDETFSNIGYFFTAKFFITDEKIILLFTETEHRFKSPQKIEFIYCDDLKASLTLEIDKEEGFLEEGFWMCAENDKIFWHKAISIIQMYRFAHAILCAGSKTFN